MRLAPAAAQTLSLAALVLGCSGTTEPGVADSGAGSPDAGESPCFADYPPSPAPKPPTGPSSVSISGDRDGLPFSWTCDFTGPNDGVANTATFIPNEKLLLASCSSKPAASSGLVPIAITLMIRNPHPGDYDFNRAVSRVEGVEFDLTVELSDGQAFWTGSVSYESSLVHVESFDLCAHRIVARFEGRWRAVNGTRPAAVQGRMDVRF